MSRKEIDWSIPQRQSPAALIILLLKVMLDVLKLFWPLLLVLVLKKKGGSMDIYGYAALAISFLSIVISGLDYYYFRFFIVMNELVIKKGFFIKKTIKLPLDKIQAVHMEQTWLHNLLHVSRISIDSAGSEKTEAKIEALDSIRASAIREFILGHYVARQTSQPDQPSAQGKIITLGGKDLLKLCVSANHLRAFFLLLVFFYTILENIGVSDKEYNRLWNWLMDYVYDDSIRLFLFLSLAVIIISIGFSFVKIILTYFNFSISKASKGFHISSGLINKKEKFIPFRKIQFISWEANWVRKKLGLYMLQFQTIGDEYFEKKMQVKVPVTRAAFIPLLTEYYQPLLPVKEISPIKIHRAYIQRNVMLAGLIPVFVLLPVLYFYFDANSFFTLLWIPFVWFNSWLFQRRFRLWADTASLQIKKGVFGVEELVLRWNNIQSVRLSQSIYQRKHRLATLHFRTAGGIIKVPFIELQTAEKLMNFALYKIEISREPWM